MTNSHLQPRIDYAGITQSETEAAERYNDTLDCDPFPEIPATLLNSADIYEYIRVTGMVCPFNDEQLKTASCSLRIGSQLIYWEESNNLVNKTLSKGETFISRPNSIIYVNTKEIIQLPNYIALRFNLKINYVHRGLLLGTGPIVDPGFQGRLLIPLHNLTTNTYHFTEGENIIWAEFTKTSPYTSWNRGVKDQREKYNLAAPFKIFPEKKKNLSPWDYLNEAHGGPIRSSIADAVKSAQLSAKSAETQSKIISIGTVLGLLAAVIGGYALIQQTHNLTEHSLQFSSATRGEFQEFRGRTEEKLTASTNEIEQSSTFMRREISKLTEQVKGLMAEMESLRTKATSEPPGSDD